MVGIVRQRVPRKLKKLSRPTPCYPKAATQQSIRDYVEAVLTQRTVVNDDTTAERLARGITGSILHRLGYSEAQAFGDRPLRRLN